MRITKLLVAVLLVLSCFGIASAQVANGNFEKGFDGWTLVRGSEINSDCGRSSTGNCACIQGFKFSPDYAGIKQTVNFTGAEFLEYWLRNAEGNANVRVTIDGEVVSTSVPRYEWKKYSINTTGYGGLHELAFENNDLAYYVDDVALVYPSKPMPAPEFPTVIIVIGIAIALISVAGKL